MQLFPNATPILREQWIHLGFFFNQVLSKSMQASVLEAVRGCQEEIKKFRKMDDKIEKD